MALPRGLPLPSSSSPLLSLFPHPYPLRLSLSTSLSLSRSSTEELSQPKAAVWEPSSSVPAEDGGSARRDHGEPGAPPDSNVSLLHKALLSGAHGGPGSGAASWNGTQYGLECSLNSQVSVFYSCLRLTPAPLSPAGFADICHRSTDFHFPAYAEQLSAVQECAVRAAEARHSAKQPVLESSSSSQTSDSQPLTPRGGSPFYSPDKGSFVLCLCVNCSRCLYTSLPTFSLPPPPPPLMTVLHGASDNSSFSQHLSPPPASSGAVGGSREGGRFLESPTTEQDARPVRLQPGSWPLINVVTCAGKSNLSLCLQGISSSHVIPTCLKFT